MAQAEILLFKNIQVVVERKSFRKSLSVYLYPDRPVTVRASRMTSQKMILDFLKSKETWIEKHFSKIQNQKRQWNPPRIIKFNQEFPLMGKNLRIRPVITLGSKYFFSRTEDDLLLHVPRDHWSEEVYRKEFPQLAGKLREFYKKEGIREVTKRVALYSSSMNLTPKLLRWHEPKTRWGSCSSRGSIQFNWRMIVFDIDLIDYIVVHELSHLQHMNHSKEFWTLVGKILPDYKERTQKIKDQQMLTEFLSFSENSDCKEIAI